ncbi:MAG TPA: DUF4258 domain-containing protein [Terriglobia bacterium]|nr:DUF4258 domain-containing protein [Terriglobia bacterium]
MKALDYGGQRPFPCARTPTNVREANQRGRCLRGHRQGRGNRRLRPYPSRLVLGWIGARPLHTVVADNLSENELIVITVYEPDSEVWEADFKRRKL